MNSRWCRKIVSKNAIARQFENENRREGVLFSKIPFKWNCDSLWNFKSDDDLDMILVQHSSTEKWTRISAATTSAGNIFWIIEMGFLFPIHSSSFFSFVSLSFSLSPTFVNELFHNIQLDRQKKLARLHETDADLLKHILQNLCSCILATNKGV